METYHDFTANVYSEELYHVTESEHDEVMTLMAEPEPEWDGYEDWSEDLEAAAWQGSLPAQTPHGEILIKRACEHSTCPHTECLRSDLRLGGIAV